MMIEISLNELTIYIIFLILGGVGFILCCRSAYQVIAIKRGWGYKVSPLIIKILLELKQEEEWKIEIDHRNPTKLIHKSNLLLEIGPYNDVWIYPDNKRYDWIMLNAHERHLLYEKCRDVIDRFRDRKNNELRRAQQLKERSMRADVLKKLGETDDFVVDYLSKE